MNSSRTSREGNWGEGNWLTQLLLENGL